MGNYKIAELDAVPSLSANGEYTLSGGYAMNFDSAGFVYSVLLDSETAEAVYDGKNGTLTFPASVMEALEAGSHEVKIITPVVTLSAEIRVVDNRVAEFSDTKVTYKALRKESVKACGSFTEGIELISLKQIVREYDDGYSGAGILRKEIRKRTLRTESFLKRDSTTRDICNFPPPSSIASGGKRFLSRNFLTVRRERLRSTVPTCSCSLTTTKRLCSGI